MLRAFYLMAKFDRPQVGPILHKTLNDNKVELLAAVIAMPDYVRYPIIEKSESANEKVFRQVMTRYGFEDFLTAQALTLRTH